VGILDKLLKRNRVADHDKWLEAHPGKGRVTMEAPGVSAQEEADMRSRMEDELAAQRAKREE
jgi:hypothetical protein